MLVGASGSGKTTVRGDLLAAGRDDLPKMPLTSAAISRDDILEDWARESGDDYQLTFLKRCDEGEDEMFRQLREAASKDQDIIFDQTNLTVELRAERLAYVPEHYTKVCVALEVPIEELLSRIEARRLVTGKSIPEFVPVNHVDMYERPSFEEGFDEIYIIDSQNPQARPLSKECPAPAL